MMSMRLAAVLVTVCLCSGEVVFGQTPPPLSRQQRDLLQALVTAVDRAAASPPATEHDWLLHVLRASDGSHYVAVSVTPPAAALPDEPIVLYVRLATAAAPGATTIAEQSAVREWLAGSRTDPRLLPARRGMAIGDMPPMGAGAVGARGAASVGSADLQALALERERSRERREEEEKRRKAALESASASLSGRLPFEDFEVGRGATFADGTRAIQRALTAGPGTYDLYLAWVGASQPAARAQVHVARRSLQLGPAAATEFGISSVIVADRIDVRQAPFSPLEQRAHPYAIGLTEITPARDAVLTPAEQLSVAFQIVNPFPSPSGKPDVRVEMRLTRLIGSRDEHVAALSPLTYDTTTLPPDFDARLGHPLIAAMSAPLSTVPRGAYRLMITAEDRLAGTVVAADARFTVVGTPESLLAEAPSLGPRFQPATALREPILSELLDRLAPEAPSPALTNALRSARTGRFADLLVADTVPPAEQGARTALSGLGLLSLGNPSATAEFQRALVMQAPMAPVQFLLAASRAMQGRDNEAIPAWEAARKAGFTAATIDRLLAESYLRLKDFPRAAGAIGPRPATDDAADIRTFAATRIATRRDAEAVAALDTLLAAQPDDVEARWLLVHALYSELVHGNRDRRDRAAAEAQRYIDAKGPHAALAAEWLAVARR